MMEGDVEDFSLAKPTLLEAIYGVTNLQIEQSWKPWKVKGKIDNFLDQNKMRVQRELERKIVSKVEKEVWKSETEKRKEKGNKKVGEKTKSRREKD
ncbi:hypothetical protein CR513_20608, partial [Mucuna pruriens]